MKTIIIFVLTLFACNLAVAQRIIDRHDPNYVKFENGDYLTDKYSYKFQGHWLWKSGTNNFEIVFERQITDFNGYNKTDGMHCWIKYVKNGVVVVDNIKNRTFRYTNVATGDPSITYNILNPSYKNISNQFSGSGSSLSEYVLEMDLYDIVNNRQYVTIITMDSSNTNKIIMILKDTEKYRGKIRRMGDPEPDTKVYYPTPMTLIRQQ